MTNKTLIRIRVSVRAWIKIYMRTRNSHDKSLISYTLKFSRLADEICIFLLTFYCKLMPLSAAVRAKMKNVRACSNECNIVGPTSSNTFQIVLCAISISAILR